MLVILNFRPELIRHRGSVILRIDVLSILPEIEHNCRPGLWLGTSPSRMPWATLKHLDFSVNLFAGKFISPAARKKPVSLKGYLILGSSQASVNNIFERKNSSLKVSIGTEIVLGLKKLRADTLPTTAYLMMGERCSGSCLFCPQAGTSSSDRSLLSRVTWNKVNTDVWPLIERAFTQGKIFRACIQVVNHPGILDTLAREVSRARSLTRVPLCISGAVNSLRDAERLFQAGADRITIALDAASPQIYKRVKGPDFTKRLRLLEECVAKFPGRFGTHLIAGLGETEEEMLDTIQYMQDMGIAVGLFAFTPVKGSGMEEWPRPAVESYRRIQTAHYLIRMGICRKEDMVFRRGELSKLPLPNEKIKDILADGSAFLTSGCPGCNRPYYNESPSSTMFNYPRKLTGEEVKEAVRLTGIIS